MPRLAQLFLLWATALGLQRPAPPKQRLTPLRVDVQQGLIVAGGLAALAATTLLPDEKAERKAARAAEEKAAEERLEARRIKAYIEPRETWTEEDLKPYDGTDYDGPILLAADGTVFNVWKGRHFYAPGGPYASMAGRDASRQLAKNRLDGSADYEPDDGAPLNLAEQASLAAWAYSFREKYDDVGKLVD
mmetsp:Transcript_11847/g.35291  ORF Transcript_11847/g.35291 Transcript_11847/m.35291 type:complete len:190 (+) Transcript_11847:84-653(+)